MFVTTPRVISNQTSNFWPEPILKPESQTNSCLPSIVLSKNKLFAEREINSDGHNVLSVTFDPDGSAIGSERLDGTFTLWHVSPFTELQKHKR